ncbi:uncharacterized protein L3040_001800 [Drepanopeziza brunnea f. sp. 'multigermtubi']|uniref:uncharacterized protein n=1 Tax=Drepanopeziza brunnea f. sp. 'multigermtubi' TaxID=698441 RepID=UPI002396E589|nr:hypothetical protein L3040_001800 [Drepanopeziza brunnea f. sp. 'multigermtubi']
MDSRLGLPQQALSKNEVKASFQGQSANEEFDFDAKIERETVRKPSGSVTVTEGGLQIRAAADVIMDPKPSNLPEDPLNWPRWKKEAAFGTLMIGTAVVGILKSMLVTVNSVVAIESSVDYVAAAALTGAPLMFGALAGLMSQMSSQLFGKRGIYIGSAVLILVGALWNMHVYNIYAQFMVSRIFQGIGWGMFEALISSSIADLFFVHERGTRVNIHNVVSISFTWGTPIVGGYVSQSVGGYRNQLMIASILQAISILLLIFASPETTFDRASSQPPSVDIAPSKSSFKQYLDTLKFTNPHSISKFDVNAALQPLKALIAPSTILTTLLTAPLLGSAFGIANSLSLMFSTMPTLLFPTRLGCLFVLPLIFSLLAYSLGAFLTYVRIKPPYHLGDSPAKTLTVAAPGLLIGVSGLLAFGMCTSTELMPEVAGNGTAFEINVAGMEISLQAVAAAFGMMVGGAVMLEYSGATYLSTFASPNRPGDSELAGAHHVLQELVVGIWVIGFPMWISGDGVMGGLENTATAIGVLVAVIGGSVVVLLSIKGDVLRNIDIGVLRRGPESGNGDGRI